MYADDNHTEDDTGSNSAQPTPQNHLQSVLGRLTGEPPRVQSAVDVHGRYWLRDRKNPDEAYIWSRQTIDVEVVR
ncbi:hypothetical protein [Natrinema sp. DC36]|uniref:hypothetical protein n=1 Tax=Natrinema sp. DC36 TaxID=2878680 RepID=UPI001CEFBE92|nr:hypothetical protein [Natrinema sp. DC36]